MAGFRGNAILRRLPAEGTECVAAEIGVDEGTTSGWLLGWHRTLWLVMVDPWRVPDADSSYGLTGDTAAIRSQGKHDKCKKLAKARTALAGPRAEIYADFSVNVSEEFSDGHFDLVFIDGDHSFEGVREDIEAWWPKVRKGGWIGGHDYLKTGNFPGVHKAVDMSFGDNVELDEDSTWWVRKTV
jgi:hypothetical protein